MMIEKIMGWSRLLLLMESLNSLSNMLQHWLLPLLKPWAFSHLLLFTDRSPDLRYQKDFHGAVRARQGFPLTPPNNQCYEGETCFLTEVFPWVSQRKQVLAQVYPNGPMEMQAEIPLWSWNLSQNSPESKAQQQPQFFLAIVSYSSLWQSSLPHLNIIERVPLARS